MFELTKGEREFLNSGGILWTMSEKEDNTWELQRLHNGASNIFPIRPHTVERAEDWIFALATISSFCFSVTVHHSISRRNASEMSAFPLMSEE